LSRILDLLARIPAKSGGNAADGEVRDALTQTATTSRSPWNHVAIPVFLFNPAHGEVGRLPCYLPRKIMSSITSSRRCAFPRSALKPLVVAVSFALPAISFAQTASNGDAQTVVVTASRNAQAPRDVLTDNIVITADQIEKSGQTNLVALLQQQRGLEIATNGSAGASASVFVRGANSDQTLVLIDGVRIGSSTTGGATWENIPLAQIDHIEIVYGPLSSLYGSDAIGGVVQIFTKQGDGAAHPSVMVGYGSYNERAVEASIGGSTAGDEKFHYALGVSRDESDGFPATTPQAGPYLYNTNKDGYDKESASGQFGFDWAKGHTVGIDFLQSRNSAGFDQDPQYVDHQFERLNTVSIYSRDQFAPNWKSVVQLSQSEDKASDTNAPSPSNSVFNTTQNEFSWQNDFTIGTDLLQFVVGRREEKIDTNTAGLGGERDTNSVAGSYQWKSGNQLAVISLRDDDSSQYGSQTTGGLAYGYRLSNTLRVNASYGTSFRAPTFNELYYPGYGIASNQPEKGKDAETGIYYNDGKSQLSAVYYHNRITDLLVYAPICPVQQATHPYGCAYNVDHALLSGLTIGGQTKFGDFTVHGSVDFQDPVDETTDSLLVRRSRHHGEIGVDYQAGQWNAGVDGVFSGSRNDTNPNGNLVAMGGYGLVNLHAEYQFAKDWSVFGRWNNVLNKSYDLAYGYATPGSNAFVGLRYGFK
jgi:vitamin B12 transporter